MMDKLLMYKKARSLVGDATDATINGHYEFISHILIDGTATINTPVLFVACKRGHEIIGCFFLQRMAKPGLHPYLLFQALPMACLNGYPKLVEAPIIAAADTNALTTLDGAHEDTPIVRTLERNWHYASLLPRNALQTSLRRFEYSWIDFNTGKAAKRTADREETIKALLSSSMDVNAKVQVVHMRCT